ncbi:T9SS type B sorting domain-containing protein [Confluentibacter sediminis]|uniref:T9SS type B sorting domain-containing protein n=1 Tax=Confluentibacter sediminis TaxID=2219045 RepID=UPI000DAC1EC6|nr:choice-of-anchor L domain-containing protein [Confluentibacter sediminis]
MNKNLQRYYFITLLLFSVSIASAQKITVNSTASLEDLVETLIDGCVEVSNVTSSMNGSNYGITSYGEFTQGSSKFPFENGIVLSTGNVFSVNNPSVAEPLSEGMPTWGTDSALESVLGISNTLNATSIEFDIVSISDQLQFNYILASEEYSGNNSCYYSDRFAILIKEGSGPYQNIALVPGTPDPVNTQNIRPQSAQVNCPAVNENYFAGYNTGETNFEGRTTILTASTTIVPNQTYHIKLIIADQTDQQFDSAVFIQGNSIKPVDLGEDVTTCSKMVLLDADINNSIASYKWFFKNSEISLETKPTLSAKESGLYRVEVTVPGISTPCTDEINISLGNEISIVPIENYYLCDINELFDLSTRDIYIIDNNPTINTKLISYHPSLTDAQGNTGTITTPVSNSTYPLVYARVEDINGCIGYTPINLVVSDPPTMPTTTSFNFCVNDNEPVGFTTIDLTQYDDYFTGMDPDLVVSYHNDNTQATNGGNPLTTYDYNNGDSSPLTFYVRLYNTQTGCFNTASMTINILEKPEVATERVFLNACEAVNGMDGFDVFDLTKALDDIVLGPTSIPPTFYESEEDAETGSNAIMDPKNYKNIEPYVQTVYVRVEDANTCFTIVPFEIHTNLMLTGTNLGDFAICNTQNQNTLEFYLSDVTTHIANNLPNITVAFFESDADYTNNKPITGPTVLVQKDLPKTLIIEINDDTNCPRKAQIILRINPVLIFNPSVPITYCDNDDDVTDGKIMVDLSYFDSIVTDGQTDFSVSYFLDKDEAEANNIDKRLPNFYTTGSTTIYARIVSNIDSRCAGVSEFEIDVIPAPEVTPPQPKIICDTDDQEPDGKTIINLNDIRNEIVNNPSQFTINFYDSKENAESGSNPIPNASSFLATTQTIFVRVDNVQCSKIVPYSIIINTKPIIGNIKDLLICEDDNNQTEYFVLSEKDADILDGQIGKEVYYFTNPTDASSGDTTRAIPKNTPYELSNQNIYVRVENISDARCSATSSFIVKVSANPIYNKNFEPFFKCDNDNINGEFFFDLNEKITQIKQGTPNPSDLNISFYKTPDLALAGDLPLPLQYVKDKNSETLYVRIQSNSTKCVVIENLNINIIAAPKLSDARPLAVCDTYTDIYDGTALFNLKEADFINLDRSQIGTVIHYFEHFDDINQNDVHDNSLAITNIENYLSNRKTIYIKATNTNTDCFTVIPLELVVNAPPKPNTIGTVGLCDNDTNTQDLSIVEAQLLNDPTVTNFDFYTDSSFSSPLPGKLFTYSSIGDFTIYVRITNKTSLCDITTSFNLRIKETPVANTPPDLVACDDDYDGILVFDLSQNDAAILGSQDPAIHNITYYSSFSQAEAGINKLDNLHPAVDGDTIFARLENINTECPDITQFKIFVNPLPVVPVDDVVPLCINDLPLIIDAYTGNPNDTYLWSTGDTTSQIELGLGDIGEYWIQITSDLGCPSPQKPFSVIESAIADINFTTTVDFSDPNSITVDVSGIGNYVYILDDGDPQKSNVFENVSLGNHTVTVRDLNGCDDTSQSVTVFDIPKFVTPNNDGYFDRWHVVDFTKLPGTVVYIYDRYGKLLKTLTHTSLGWDGTFNGYNMPADDYWFVANIIQEGNAFTIKGHFALKR